jgi:hypothetical protein
MQSKKINELATNLVPAISDLVTIGNPSTGELKKITLNQIASLFGSVGGVSSVGMTVPTGLTVTGSPITTSGTLAVSLTSGYSIPTTAKQTEWDAGYSDRLKWDGGASGLNASTARSSLGLVIGTDVLAYRTFGSAANNNTGDFATASQGSNADTAYSLRLTGASLPLSISGNVISIAQSSSTINGFLSSTDFNIFNAKQQALNGTGFVKASGTSITYDNSIYLTTSAAASTYLTISNASSTYLPLSGGTLIGSLNGTSATFSSSITSNQSDTFLISQPTVVGAAQYQSWWNSGGTRRGYFGFGSASSNILSLVNETGGSLNFGGAATFSSSVTASSLIKSGGTSSQFLKADGSIDSSAYITLTSLSAVNPLFYNTTYGTFSISQANTSTSGYVSSADWNTFNNKQPAGSYLTGNQSIFFNPSGDVTGTSTGSTTLNPVLTLATITQSTGSSFVKITLDTKGRVTGNTSVSLSDITSTLGYTPYNATNPNNYIALTSLSAVNPLFYNTTSGTFTINVANTSQSGYLTSSDWNLFYNKQPAGSYLTDNQNISFSTLSGDVSGSSTGATNLNPTLVLNTITQGSGSNFVKINIDTKGRVTGNSSVTSSDITTSLGYTPYNSTNPSGYITSAGSSAYATSAGSISGYNNPTTAGTANTIAYRDSFGYLYAIAFYEYSDIRFKNVLETNPIIDVKGIDVIKFNRKDNASIRYGYSAQQVKEFVPEAVNGDNELVVNYSDIHTLKIAALERRILELENKLK